MPLHSVRYGLNGKEAWDLWFSLGSFEKVQAELTGRGAINFQTGRPITRQGMYHSAWSWARDHVDEAKADWKRACEERHVAYNEEDFNVKLVKAVRATTYSDKKFWVWSDEHGFRDYERFLSAKWHMPEHTRPNDWIQLEMIYA